MHFRKQILLESLFHFYLMYRLSIKRTTKWFHDPFTFLTVKFKYYIVNKTMGKGEIQAQSVKLVPTELFNFI